MNLAAGQAVHFASRTGYEFKLFAANTCARAKQELRELVPGKI